MSGKEKYVLFSAENVFRKLLNNRVVRVEALKKVTVMPTFVASNQICCRIAHAKFIRIEFHRRITQPYSPHSISQSSKPIN